MKNLPGIDILYIFLSDALPILNRIVFETAVLYPASSKIAFKISVTELLPFVPVTAMTFIFREGKRYIRAPHIASLKWYIGAKELNNFFGTSFLIFDRKVSSILFSQDFEGFFHTVAGVGDFVTDFFESFARGIMAKAERFECLESVGFVGRHKSAIFTF